MRCWRLMVLNSRWKRYAFGWVYIRGVWVCVFVTITITIMYDFWSEILERHCIFEYPKYWNSFWSVIIVTWYNKLYVCVCSRACVHYYTFMMDVRVCACVWKLLLMVHSVRVNSLAPHTSSWFSLRYHGSTTLYTSKLLFNPFSVVRG